MLCVREKLPEIDMEAERVPSALLDSMLVSPEHVHRALSLTNPYHSQWLTPLAPMADTTRTYG